MGRTYTDDFFRDQYNFEIEHKHKLDSHDSLHVGILVALAGVAVYYSKMLPSCGCGVSGFFFWFLCICFFLTLAFGIVLAITSILPRNKEYIASPKEWGEHVQGLEAYHRWYHNQDEADQRVSADLASTLRSKYIEAAQTNRNLNVLKMASQTWVRRAIAAAVVILLLNAIPAYFVQCARQDIQKAEIVKLPAVQKIEIVSPNVRSEPVSQGQRPPSPQGQAGQPKPPTPPQKPEPPANVLIREGQTNIQKK